MSPEQIKDQIDAIRTVSARLIAEGPEACRKFLEDAGIISKAEAGDNQEVPEDGKQKIPDDIMDWIADTMVNEQGFSNYGQKKFAGIGAIALYRYLSGKGMIKNNDNGSI